MDQSTIASRMARFDIVEKDVDLGSRVLRVSLVRDINAMVDAMGPDDFGPDERLPYWATLWPSSLELSRCVLESNDIEGPVLELGAGLGLCSIAAAIRGFAVLSTDHEVDALLFLEHNAALNGTRVQTREFDFRSPDDLGKFQTILASDVLYEERKVVPLAQCIARFLSRNGRSFVADPGRGHLPYLELMLAEYGLTSETREIRGISILESRYP